MEDLIFDNTSESRGIKLDIIGNVSEPIIVLNPNGDIFVKGKLIENDKEFVDAMREFLKESGFIK